MTRTCPSCGHAAPLTPAAGRESACPACGETLRAADTVRPKPTLPPSLADFLTFRRMIVPLIIQVIFWIGTGLCVLVGLAAGIDVAQKQGQPFVGLAVFAVCAAVGTLVVRIACELLIVVFRIHDTLTDLKDLLRRERP